jgi:hypothetical protein
MVTEPGPQTQSKIAILLAGLGGISVIIAGLQAFSFIF